MQTQKHFAQLIMAVLVMVCGAATALGDGLTFCPTDDSFIVARSPAQNYGSSEEVIVENRYGAGSQNWQMDTLLKFDLSSIPAGTEIPSATLSLYYYDHHDNDPVGRELTCYRITDDWDEDTVNWNNQPGHAPLPTTSSFVPPATGVWMAWDVTSDVQAFVNDPEVDNYGWQLADDVEPWGTFDIPWTEFYSKEYGDFLPCLTVVPEPATLSLLGLGALVAAHRRR